LLNVIDVRVMGFLEINYSYLPTYLTIIKLWCVYIAGSPEGAGEQVEHGRLLAQRDVRVGRGGRPVTHPPGDAQQVAPRHRLIQLTPLQPAFYSQGKTPRKSLLGTDSSSSLLFSPPSILKVRRPASRSSAQTHPAHSSSARLLFSR
jgi:hypothetical protein